MSQLLTTPEAARFLHLSCRTLERLRLEGSGPRYCKLRRSVRYRQADLESWLADSARHSTSEAVQ
jgi:predicted DNA-binding transcriptional regulator AlpA